MRLASPGEVNYPKSFVANVIGYGGEQGKRWLRDLPDLIAAVRRRWRLDNLQALPGLSFNYLAKARRQGESCVVKLIWEADALAGETAWLQDQRGRGAVAVRAVADDLGAYLMEALEPGRAAVELGETEATQVVAERIAALAGQQPSTTAKLPRVAAWFTDLWRLAAQPPAGIEPAAIDRARGIGAALMVAPHEERLLHGDFHHGNILAHGDGWRVIDPKGVLGDPAYDCAAMFRNRLDDVAAADLPSVLGARLSVLADVTGFDVKRIAGWAYAQTVLSTAWSVEAGQRRDAPRGMAVADALLALQ